jgi:hypothetical protein
MKNRGECNNQWQEILDKLTERSRSPRLTRRHIYIVMRKRRFSPWWMPYLWLVQAAGAYTVGRAIFIGCVLDKLPATVKTYLVAHELGHIEKRHGLNTFMSAMLIPGSTLLGRAPTLALGVLFFGFTWLVLTRRIAEYQADDFAMQLIGPKGVLDGLQNMDKLLGRKPGPLRRRRIDNARKKYEQEQHGN